MINLIGRVSLYNEFLHFLITFFRLVFLNKILKPVNVNLLYVFFSSAIVLPHQQEIERMSSFREQLGEDWLRYQHHLEATSTLILTANSTVQPTHHLPNGLNATLCPSTTPKYLPALTALEVPDVLPPPLLSSKLRVEPSEGDAEHDAESTLQWLCQSPGHTEFTLENSMMDSQVASQGAVSPSGQSPESQKSAGRESCDTKEEEEEQDLGGRMMRQRHLWRLLFEMYLAFFYFSIYS